MVELLDSQHNVASSISGGVMSTFGQILLGNSSNPLSPQEWVNNITVAFYKDSFGIK